MDRGELAEEADEWVDDGVINREQADEILSRYPEDEEDRSRIVKVVALVGAVLVGSGLLLFVGANWESIPELAQLGFLAVTTGAFLVSGLYLDREGVPQAPDALPDALYLVGSIAGGVSVGLTDDILRLGVNDEWLVFVAAGIALCVAYAAVTVPSLVLGNLLAGAWLVVLFDELLFVALGFYGIAVYGVALAHRATRWDSFVSVHKAFGAGATLGGVFSVVVAQETSRVESAAVPLVVLGLAGVALVVYFHASERAEIAVDVYEVGWAVGALGVVAFAGYLGDVLPDAVFAAGINVLFFGLVLLTMVSGYAGKSRYVFNVGVLGFVVYLGDVYFTTVFETIPRSLALVLGGLLLLGGGYYLERKRRETLEGIEA